MTGAAGAPVSYERISRFRVDIGGNGATVTRGVDRQADDANKAADLFGLGPIARHFTDNNRSASEYATREREAWEEMLTWIEEGRVSAVLVWVLDRVIRQTEDLDRLLKACRAANIKILQTASGVWIDPHSPDSRLQAKISAAVAEYEAAKGSMRAKRMHDAKAQSGQYHGGRRRFGFNDGMTEHVPAEAAIVRELATRIIRGETLGALAADLKARDVRTVSGGFFTSPNLGVMFRKGAHLAGMRNHNGDVARDESGEPIAAVWAPILTREEWQAARAVLTNPARRASGSNARKYLMSGLLLCGVCSTPVRSHPSKRTGVAYRCPAGTCVYRAAALVDEAVADLVAGYCVRERYDYVTPRYVDGADLEAEETEIRRLLDVALEDKALGVYTREEYLRAKARLTAELEAIDARRVRKAQPSAVMRDFLAADGFDAARALFVASPLGTQREVVREIGAFVLHKAPHRGAPFHPSHVTHESEGTP